MTKMLKVVGASWLQTKISSYILGILGVLAILTLLVGQIERIQEDGTYAATVFYSEKTGYRIEYWGQSNELADIPRGVARAYFRMDLDTTGWSLLEVETDGSYDDDIQAYAAGIVEGALTWYLIHTHIKNTITARCEDLGQEKQCDKLRDALNESVEAWKAHAAERASEDPFWHHVSLYYSQINGIYTGWKHGIERKELEYTTDISDLYWLNSVAELAELERKLNTSIEDPALYSLPDLSTAFLRVVNETSEDGTITRKMFLAQNGAGRYSSMMRILKRYKLNYHQTSPKEAKVVRGESVEFTGYPGSITSQDEFYIVRGDNHKLAITGTALRNYNSKLWKDVNIIDQVPIGPRVTAANHLANNVSSWGHVIARSNSGTASKQWLVVDFKRFDSLEKHADVGKHVSSEVVTESTVNKDVRHTIVYHGTGGQCKGLAGVVEQVAGRTHAADISDAVLDHGYWATYGLPFFKDIANATHIPQMQEIHGNIFSDLESPRAIIFRQMHKNATSLDSIIKLMRQNNITAMNRLKNDAGSDCDDGVDCVFSEKGYWSVLGVRGDVVKQHKEAFGVIDTKIAYGTLNNTLEFVAISSPPYTEAQNNTKINKGNVAPIYTQQFNNKPNIDGIEIRDLVKQQQEEAELETMEQLNRNTLQPFEWSESEFRNTSHRGLPDRWDFEPFRPKFSW